jgi:hypothetical protein
MPNLAAIVALGRIAHDTTAVALGRRISALKFGHGATHEVDTLTVFDSYHCSRYNTNTGVLTTEMFAEVFAAVRAYLDDRSHAATTPRSIGRKHGIEHLRDHAVIDDQHHALLQVIPSTAKVGRRSARVNRSPASERIATGRMQSVPLPAKALVVGVLESTAEEMGHAVSSLSIRRLIAKRTGCGCSRAHLGSASQPSEGLPRPPGPG